MAHVPMPLYPLQIRLVIERRIHISRTDRVTAYAMRRPFRSEALTELDHARFGGIVGALLLWVEDSDAGYGGEEYDGAGGFVGDHGAGTGG